MFSINAKLVLLVLWIVAIIAVVVYLLCIAYIRDNLEEKERLLGLSREELLETVQTDDGEGGDDR